MLRAVRFAAQLGFELEGETRRAIGECAPLAASLSAERVRDELVKTLRSPRPELAWELLSTGLMARYAGAVGPAPPLSRLPQYARLAHLCRELETRGCIGSAEEFLRALRFDRRTVRAAASATAAGLRQPGTTSGCCATTAGRPCSPPGRTAASSGASSPPGSAGAWTAWRWAGRSCWTWGCGAESWERRSRRCWSM